MRTRNAVHPYAPRTAPVAAPAPDQDPEPVA